MLCHIGFSYPLLLQTWCSVICTGFYSITKMSELVIMNTFYSPQTGHERSSALAVHVGATERPLLKDKRYINCKKFHLTLIAYVYCLGITLILMILLSGS